MAKIGDENFELKKTIGDSRSEVNRKKEEILDIKRHLNQRDLDIESWKKSYEELSGKYDDLHIEAKDKDQCMFELERACKEADQAASILKSILEARDSELKDFRQKHEIWNQEIYDKDSLLKNLSRESEELKNELTH